MVYCLTWKETFIILTIVRTVTVVPNAAGEDADVELGRENSSGGTSRHLHRPAKDASPEVGAVIGVSYPLETGSTSWPEKALSQYERHQREQNIHSPYHPRLQQSEENQESSLSFSCEIARMFHIFASCLVDLVFQILSTESRLIN